MRHLLRHQDIGVDLVPGVSRNLQQGKPDHPDLSISSTADGIISATAEFYQDGNRYIRVFQNDCVSKFNPGVEFSIVDGGSSEGSEWYGTGTTSDPVNFEIPTANLHEHLNDVDGGEVDVCIQLETTNTLSNIQIKVLLDLTGATTAFTVGVKQPDAINTSVSIETDVVAWVCDGSDANPDTTNRIQTLEVPGKIYVCIKVTEGYAIQNGALTVDAAVTEEVDDKIIGNYMDMDILQEGITGIYNVEDTCQIMSPNFVRLSFMGDKTWAPFQATTDLTITVDAYFEPERRRLLPGIRMAQDTEFASFTTTVQVKAPEGPKKIPAAIAGVIIACALSVVFLVLFVARKMRSEKDHAHHPEKSIEVVSNDCDTDSTGSDCGRRGILRSHSY